VPVQPGARPRSSGDDLEIQLLGGEGGGGGLPDGVGYLSCTVGAEMCGEFGLILGAPRGFVLLAETGAARGRGPGRGAGTAHLILCAWAPASRPAGSGIGENGDGKKRDLLLLCLIKKSVILYKQRIYFIKTAFLP
jgi:hypothetical protein